MDFFQQIESDLAESMRAHNESRTAVLRLLKNALKNEQIKLRRELSAEETIKVLQREAKQRRESIEAYEQAGRNDLAEAEKAEMAIIAVYLPETMDGPELAAIVEAAIVETGAKDVSQMGMVIGRVMAKAGGTADGSTVSRLVREKLRS